MPSIKKKVKSEQVTFKLPLLILELPWVTKAEFQLTITSIPYQADKKKEKYQLEDY